MQLFFHCPSEFLVIFVQNYVLVSYLDNTSIVLQKKVEKNKIFVIEVCSWIVVYRHGLSCDAITKFIYCLDLKDQRSRIGMKSNEWM